MKFKTLLKLSFVCIILGIISSTVSLGSFGSYGSLIGVVLWLVLVVLIFVVGIGVYEKIKEVSER